MYQEGLPHWPDRSDLIAQDEALIEAMAKAIADYEFAANWRIYKGIARVALAVVRKEV